MPSTSTYDSARAVDYIWESESAGSSSDSRAVATGCNDRRVHWGNFGSAVGGIATLILALIAVAAGTAGLSDWRQKQRAQRDLAREQRLAIELDRRRSLLGWSQAGVNVYGVTLVVEPNEMSRAVAELSEIGPTDYVILRVSESDNGNANRAESLRNLITTDRRIARTPSDGEFEALQEGRKILMTRSVADGG